ncbi:MAG: methylated-DNA--protein-cysteine methyltransferase [Firmicutes bacterium]|nr:methylated-DNA--protein-cysteine methyltransferase [Bacillota bacterium]
MKKIFFYDTTIGKLGIAEENGAITDVYFSGEVVASDVILEESILIKEANRQLQEYFAGKRQVFDLPLAPQGTIFQQKVWQALTEIPFGETRSYGQIAKRIGQPKASRAVGGANNKNPLPIFIPCHRVIGANGKLVGYAGGLEIKKMLLHVEKLITN